MSLNLIITTDSLNPPLTGIGYYTAHLVDELLREPSVNELRGINDHGLQDREALRYRLQELTGGELGKSVATVQETPVGYEEPEQTSVEQQPPLQAGGLKHQLKAFAKKVPGAYTVARHWYAYRHRVAMEKALAEQKETPWLLHAPNYIPPRHDGPTVITIHDLSHLRHPETHPRERIEWLDQHLPKAIAQASKIISVSEFTRSELLNLGLVSDPDKIVVCHNGLDDGFRPRENAEITQELKKWGLESGRYILSVATLEPRKNMERLLEAYEALPEHLASQFPLVLTGSAGWKNSGLRQRIARIKPPRHVITTGYLDREPLQQLLAGAGLFAYLSFYEGFGLPIIEAMASGVPVITADTGALKEVASTAGYTVDPLDVTAIRDGLTTLLEDSALCTTLRQRGLERAGEFSWQRCAKETLQVYRDVMAEAQVP